MTTRKPKQEAESVEPQAKDTSVDSSVKLKTAGEVQIQYRKSPERAPEGKRIHSRRPLPLVREAPVLNEDQQDDKEKESGAGKRES